MQDKIGVEAISLAKYVERSYEESNDPKGWVKRGEDNLFPQYLIDLYNSSAVHHGVVDSIARMIYAEGVKTDVQGELILQEWSADEELRKAAHDLKLQGGFYLQVRWNIDRTKIKDIEHVPFEYVRAGQMNEEGKISTFYHCLDWENYQRTGVNEIAAFDVETKDSYPVQLMYVKMYSVGSRYYPTPDYMGSINWIEIDKEIAIFHNNNIQNGMSPSFAIHWKNGVPDAQGRQNVRMQVERQLTGSKNAGKFWMTFSDNPDQVPEIVPFELSDASEQFQFLSSESTDKIMIGHGVTSPALFGVKVGGSLGNTEELKVASEIFDRNVIRPYQKVLETAVKRLLNASGWKGTATIESEELNFTEDLTDAEGEKWLDYLEKVGEKVSDEWVLIAEDEVTDPENEDLYFEEIAEEGKKENTVYNKAVRYFKRFANPDEKSEIDTGLYKIRYRYSQNISDKSRTFCKNMVANSRMGVVYRYEDIKNMEGVNAEFAPKGKSSYSIWLYKGGAYCHHHWVRQVYVRKRDKGKFLPNKGLENDKEVSEANAQSKGVPFKDRRKRWRTASTAPIDTPNRGKLN